MSEVDAIVVLTVGRSRATTHFHLKWAKTLGERVLVLASCRNESGVAMIQEAAAINKERVELLTYTDKVIRLQTKYHKKSLNVPRLILLQTMVVFVGKRVSIVMFIQTYLKEISKNEFILIQKQRFMKRQRTLLKIG